MVLLGDMLWLPVRPTVPIPGLIETFEAPDTLQVKLELFPFSRVSGFALNESIVGSFS